MSAREVVLPWAEWCEVAGWLGVDSDAPSPGELLEAAKHLVSERDAYRARVLVEESDVQGVTLEAALAVAKRHGWGVIGRAGGSTPTIELTKGSSFECFADRPGRRADIIASIANAVSGRSEPFVCSLDVVEEMRKEGE